MTTKIPIKKIKGPQELMKDMIDGIYESGMGEKLLRQALKYGTRVGFSKGLGVGFILGFVIATIGAVLIAL